MAVFEDGSRPYGRHTAPLASLRQGNEDMQARSHGVDKRVAHYALLGLLVASAACSVEEVQFSSRDAGTDASAATYPVTVDLGGAGMGRVIGTGGIDCPGVCSANLPSGTALALSAFAGDSSYFLGWNTGSTRECSGTGQCSLAVTSARAVTAMFVPRQALAVQMTGNGAGSIVSSPAGIECGADCSESFAPGQEIVLTAAAGTDSTFTGWVGGGCTGTGPCAVTLDNAMMISANFRRDAFVLDVTKGGFGDGAVTSTPVGINCGASCSRSYPNGNHVTLTATPASDSLFRGWSGACTGTGTCVVSMTDSRSVRAMFVQRNPTVTVLEEGSGAGWVESSPVPLQCGAVCTATVPNGTTLTLTAHPASSAYYFSRWTHSDCPGTGPCTLTITDETVIGAYFGEYIRSLFVSKLGTGEGTVTAYGIDCGTDCAEPYRHGFEVALTATPASGSRFTGWSGACSGIGACDVSMISDRSVTATFAPNGLQ